jgi:hypothetical protein
MIKKGKILQVWDKEIDDVIMYCQTIINNSTNEKMEIKGKNLNDLDIQINDQIKRWENNN